MASSTERVRALLICNEAENFHASLKEWKKNIAY